MARPAATAGAFAGLHREGVWPGCCLVAGDLEEQSRAPQAAASARERRGERDVDARRLPPQMPRTERLHRREPLVRRQGSLPVWARRGELRQRRQVTWVTAFGNVAGTSWCRWDYRCLRVLLRGAD